MKNLSESDQMFVNLFEGGDGSGARPGNPYTIRYTKIVDQINKQLYIILQSTPEVNIGDADDSLFFFDEKDSDNEHIIFRYIHPKGKSIWSPLKKKIKYEFRQFKYGQCFVYDHYVDFSLDKDDPRRSTGSPWTYNTRTMKNKDPEKIIERCYEQVRKRLSCPIIKNIHSRITNDKQNIEVSFNLKNKNNEISANDLNILYKLVNDIETICLGRYNMICNTYIGTDIRMIISRIK